MEMQWNQSACQYMQRQVWDIQNLEQTQELRLSDGMPDIGRIICTWGQCMLRSKEWRNDAVTVSGGVTAWVLYAPEDGSETRTVEVWLPFQGKWNLQDSRCEGVIRADACLRSVDARMLSSGKMLVRASVGLQVEALEPTETPVYTPPELPDGVQLLRKTYPAVLAREAGEKVFTVEDHLKVAPDMPQKILACRIWPQVAENSVVGSRAVFRGNCRVRFVYLNMDGKICSYDAVLPMAQYVDLENDYDKEATVCVMMAISSLEQEIREDGLWLKCGLIAQYVIYDRQMLDVVQDAYSPFQKIVPNIQPLRIPMVLDSTEQVLEMQPPVVTDAMQMLDVCFYPDQPTLFRQGNELQGQITGKIQMLYYDPENNLTSQIENWSEQWSLPADDSSNTYVYMENGESQVKMQMLSVTGEEIPMITGLQLGEKQETDPNRPTLILRRMGDNTLWDLAKLTGSTVDAILKANQLSGEPEPERMLLIPVT